MKSCFKNVNYGPAFQSALVEEKAVSLSPACVSLNGRTLLFLSDIHLSRRFPEHAVERLLMQIDALQPDMILLGGDYAESVKWQFQFFRMLGQLRPPLGMFGVAGNNDCERFLNGLEPLAEAMDRAGVKLLIDQTERVDTGSGVIAIAWLDEFQQARPVKKSLFSHEDASALRILLAHYPQSIAQYLAIGFPLPPHLAMAGHTHGGQFRLLGLTPYSIGFERRKKGVPLPLVCGWKTLGETQMLVSPGLGTSRIPIRIGVEPTIHRIRLER